MESKRPNLSAVDREKHFVLNVTEFSKLICPSDARDLSLIFEQVWRKRHPLPPESNEKGESEEKEDDRIKLTPTKQKRQSICAFGAKYRKSLGLTPEKETQESLEDPLPLKIVTPTQTIVQADSFETSIWSLYWDTKHLDACRSKMKEHEISRTQKEIGIKHEENVWDWIVEHNLAQKCVESFMPENSNYSLEYKEGNDVTYVKWIGTLPQSSPKEPTNLESSTIHIFLQGKIDGQAVVSTTKTIVPLEIKVWPKYGNWKTLAEHKVIQVFTYEYLLGSDFGILIEVKCCSMKITSTYAQPIIDYRAHLVKFDWVLFFQVYVSRVRRILQMIEYLEGDEKREKEFFSLPRHQQGAEIEKWIRK